MSVMLVTITTRSIHHGIGSITDMQQTRECGILPRYCNRLSIYHTVKRLGIPDSHILLWVADGMPCNARNPFQACMYYVYHSSYSAVFNDQSHKLDVFPCDVEVDYRGSEVTVPNFLRLLTGMQYCL